MKQIARRATYHVLRLAGQLERTRIQRVRSGAGWAAALVFHRLSEVLPEDGLTIRPARFASILRMLRREYRVISHGALVERLRGRVPFTGREAVVTFDDGYLDNFELAAPLLREYDIPACFFLTAGYVGTSRSFWWDEARGVASQLMTWSHARQLAEQGFEVGCHTWSHPDLGREPITSWRRELVDARSLIEDRIGRAVEHFAYPYGGPGHIRPEWLDAVREAGFRSNSSADNRLVSGTTYPYLIPRLGASPQRSLAELRIDMDAAW